MKLRDFITTVHHGDKPLVEGFDIKPLGMGMIAAQSDVVCLVGGMRSGSSPRGTTRLKYQVYRTEDLKAGKQEPVGRVELFVRDGTEFDVVGLVNIELNKSTRGQGLGKEIVHQIIDTVGHDIAIHDMKANALKFWNKMGTVLPDDRPLGKKAGQHGVIRHPSNPRSVDLPGLETARPEMEMRPSGQPEAKPIVLRGFRKPGEH